MNIHTNRWVAVTLFLSIFVCMFVHSNYSSDRSHVVVASFDNPSRSIDFNRTRLRDDFSHDGKWNDLESHRLSVNTNNFKTYTAEDFEHHFDRHGCTQTEILDQRCLYVFDEFVKLTQTYPGYKSKIRQLHAELKNLNLVQKAFYKFKGTYCADLQKRIGYLYNKLNTLKVVPQNKNHVIRDSSLDRVSSQLAEYKILKSIYDAHTPLLANAIATRTHRYNSIVGSNSVLKHARQSYSLNDNVKALLFQHGYEGTSFTECFGNQLQHTIHQESLNILDRIDSLQYDSILYDHQEALIDFTAAMVGYNHAGLTDKAMNIGDLCWTLLDYGQAIAEGVALGVYSAAHDIMTNPIEATLSIVAGKQVLAFQLCKVLYNVADIGVTAIHDSKGAQEKWNKYAEPLSNIIDAINKKEVTVRDAIKGGTAFVVAYKAQGKLLGGLGKFCNTIKQKSINFVKNNRLLSSQEYLTTPEGLLFKATSQCNKTQVNSVANLKNTAEKLAGTVWENIKLTDKMYTGTKIPKSFEFTVGKQKFWVAPNATKHMLEYLQDINGTHKKVITHNMPVNCQALLSSMKAAVRQAVSSGIRYDTMIRVGCWEFRFGMPRSEGLLPSIYHANFKPKDW